MIERTVSNVRWYLVAVHYPSALMAKSAWERAERKMRLHLRDLGIGLIRLSPNESTHRSGAPKGAHVVVGICLDEVTAAEILRHLRDGTEWDPVPEFGDALIKRRMHVMATQEQTPGSRMVIRRPEDKGARIYADGTLDEATPGRG